MLTRKRYPTRHNKGNVLVWVLFYFMLLYLVAFSYTNSFFLEELMSINYLQTAQAFEMADGGVLVGMEEIYEILKNEYSYSQDIPMNLILSKNEWILNETAKEMGFYLENPKCIYIDNEGCCFQFISKGFTLKAQKELLAKVQVDFLDIYIINEDGGLIFDRREFIPPPKLISLECLVE